MTGARAGVIVGEVVPCIPLLAVVPADRAPLALAEIWPHCLQVIAFSRASSRRNSLAGSVVELGVMGTSRLSRYSNSRRLLLTSEQRPPAWPWSDPVTLSLALLSTS